MQTVKVTQVPRWVPEDARRYLEHTENGRSIRHIARLAGCHPSTVLRQVRRVETMRDDPLVDCVLQELAQRCFASKDTPLKDHIQGLAYDQIITDPAALQTVRVHKDDARSGDLIQALVWLNRVNSVLAYAQGMDRAVIVSGRDGDQKTALDKALAGELSLRGWLDCIGRGRLVRYQINDEGRAALSSMLAKQENTAVADYALGMAEPVAPYSHGAASQPARKARYGAVEPPLSLLARLADKNGAPFLTEDLVRAGERLREDFELAQIGDHIAAAQTQFRDRCEQVKTAPASISASARERATEALAALGPGLSDIAIRCCCYLEGLETAEKQLGWSARSGKVVLRIALQQLKSHYDSLDVDDMMIG